MQNVNRSDIEFDIAVVGGHLVGALFACAVADMGYRVVLIDRESLRTTQSEEFDLRVFALNIASQRILENLGLWQAIQSARVFPYYAMHVWDAAGFGKASFDCADISATALGHIVEERVLTRVLDERIKARSNITTLYGVSLVSMEHCVEAQTLTFDNGQTLRSRLVAGADGQQSTVRKLAKMEVVAGSYAQTAIVATVAVEKSHAYTAWQRFLPTGPLAFLPLTEKTCSIVWSLDNQHAQNYLQLDDSEFEKVLSDAFAARLGRVRVLGKRRDFPLNYLYSRQYCQARTVVLGDAAHAIHPLAGQGLNLGFMDVAVLAEELKQAGMLQRDPGRIGILRRYERKRKGDNLLMLAAVSGFKQIFAEQNHQFSFIRNVGIGWFDKSDWLKKQAIRHAAGLIGELPELARPL